MGLATVGEARAKLAQRLAEIKGKVTSKHFPVPPGKGDSFRDYTGQTKGTVTVLGFLCAGKATPWWVVQCKGCGGCGVRPANRLGEAKAGGAWACRKCTKNDGAV